MCEKDQLVWCLCVLKYVWEMEQRRHLSAHITTKMGKEKKKEEKEAEREVGVNQNE